MSKSKAQRFAQNRNRNGGTLKGVVINLEKNILPMCIESEKEDILCAISLLTDVLNNWKNNYKQAKKELL